MPTDSGFQAATPGLLFSPFISFDPALDLVLRFGFGPSQLDAVDTAVPDIDEIEIIDETTEKARAARCIWPNAVACKGKYCSSAMAGKAMDARLIAGSEGCSFDFCVEGHIWTHSVCRLALCHPV